jgi:hypothetical protein
MGRAKDIIVKVIPAKVANEFVKLHHYSGKVVPNSNLHFGAFLDNKLHGVMSYGSPLDKSKVLPLVQPSLWNEMLELNRMAFDEALPKNSESRCISISIKLIKKNAPHIKWILSFADGTQCGDGTIYRASGFILSGIKKNTGQKIDEKTKQVYSQVTFSAHRPNEKQYWKTLSKLDGFQLRYIYLIDKSCKITVPILPFSKIDEMNAGMYKGQKITVAERHKCDNSITANAAVFQTAEGGQHDLIAQKTDKKQT